MDGSCEAVQRKRFRSIIRQDDPASLLRADNIKLFFAVLFVYLGVAFLPPICSSNPNDDAPIPLDARCGDSED